MAKAEAVPFYRFQLPLPRKFAVSIASTSTSLVRTQLQEIEGAV